MLSSSSPCAIPLQPWIAIFGLKPDTTADEICERLTKAIFPDPPPFRLVRIQNRGAYGVVFMAERTSSSSSSTTSSARQYPKFAAVKMQFVCPKRIRGERRNPAIRERCSAYGQRASLYETVRYESRMHSTVYNALEAAGTVLPAQRRAILPAAGKPLLSKRIIVGKKSRKKDPTIPPDGRRRLWVTVNEYVQGESLRQFLIDSKDAGTLTGELFERLCKSVLASVREFHDLGFTHGDLHSGNLIVDFVSAQKGKPWLYLIDFERTISLADMYTPQLKVLADRLTTHGHRLENAHDVFDMLKLWDLKLFCESAVGLAEGLGVSGGAEAGEAGEEEQERTGRSTAATPAMAQYLRATRLIVRLLSSYLGRDVETEEWAQTTAKTWTLKALYFKRSVSAKSLPKSIAKDVTNFDPQRRDAIEKRKFFLTLRFIQGMRTRD